MSPARASVAAALGADPGLCFVEVKSEVFEVSPGRQHCTCKPWLLMTPAGQAAAARVMATVLGRSLRVLFVHRVKEGEHCCRVVFSVVGATCLKVQRTADETVKNF